MSEKKWLMNLTKIEGGLFRTQNGIADEMIAVGRAIKAGFPTSKSDITNSKYDAIVEVGEHQRLMRIQIKGSSGNSFGFTGGTRSGKQITRDIKQIPKLYTKKDCDILMGIDSNNGDCYIIPIEKIEEWGQGSMVMNKLQDFKENWQILIDLVKEEK